jgi:hypothetical protein
MMTGIIPPAAKLKLPALVVAVNRDEAAPTAPVRGPAPAFLIVNVVCDEPPDGTAPEFWYR